MSEDDPASSRSAIVIYGTETGNAQDLANEVSRVLERHRFDVDVEEFDHIKPTSLSQYQLTVFIISTTGQGDFPSNARLFWTSLLRKKLTTTFLAGVDYAIVGLGDSSYPKFNWAARKLHKRVQQLGAESLLEPCEADEQGEDSTEGAFITWMNSFRTLLEKRFVLPDGRLPIPDTEPLPSKWILAKHDAERFAHDNGVANGVNGDKPADARDVRLQVTLETNNRVTPIEHWQDVRFLRLKSNTDSNYLPGDALAIKPHNMSEDVQTLLQTMQWQEIADEPLAIRLNRQSVRSHRFPNPAFTEGMVITLRKLLTTSLDINAIPRRSFFGAISQYTDNEMHKERLLEFTDPQYLDEYYDYATRPRRSILEILQEFDSVKIPWQEAINVLPFLRPRQFSIASGGSLKEGGNMFELLVAIVKYRTVIKRVRQGVCTRYLAQLPIGTVLDVVLKTEGRLHTSQELARSNHILVGAGTGIAPLRAIVHEKRDVDGAGSSTLIFGCRNQAADFFFREEWRDFEQASAEERQREFQLVTAFSRDQTRKLYIQDRIREHAGQLRTLLMDHSATIVVCGSSGAMPKAVRQAFVDILYQSNTEQQSASISSPEEAEKYLAQLEKAGKYKQETW